MATRFVALLTCVLAVALAQSTSPEQAPTPTSAVVVTASPSPITFKASQVSDASKYTFLTGSTIVAAEGSTSTIYHDGFVWVPEPSTGSIPPVPTQYIPTSVGSVIVVTATTGSPPPVVTYSASQDTSLQYITAQTTTTGMVVFPLGWVWIPVVPPGGVLPPILPAIPPAATPPEAVEPDEDIRTSCTSTQTPTVTIVISYPTVGDGSFETTTETRLASDDGASCTAPEVTTTSTASFQTPAVFFYDSALDGGPVPTSYPPIAMVVQDYLDSAFNSLGIGPADYATSTSSAKPGTATCADRTYDKAVPNAAAFIKGLSPNFCSDWSAAPTAALSKTYSAKDVKSGSKRSTLFGKRTPPPAPLKSDSYPGWSIDFGWSPDQVSGDCQKQDYCDRSLSSLLLYCEGYTLADAYKGGNTKDECGTLTYSIAGYPSPTTTSATTSATPSGVTCDLPTVPVGDTSVVPRHYSQSAFKAAADRFCNLIQFVAEPSDWSSAANSAWFDTTHTDPATSLPACCQNWANEHLTADQVGPHSGLLCAASDPPTKRGYFMADSVLMVRVVPSPVQTGCSPIKPHSIPRGAPCFDRLRNVFDTCTTGDKGGTVGVWKESTPDGCWDWWIYGEGLYGMNGLVDTP